MAGAIALLLGGCVPPFFFPHIESETWDTAFVLPATDEGPWLRLDNGLDLYAWRNCYVYVLRREPCDGWTLTAFDQGVQPDWPRVLRKDQFDLGGVVRDVRNGLVRPLSAHTDTDDRLLGMVLPRPGQPAKESGIYVISKAATDKYGDAERGVAPVRVRGTDIWHNLLRYLDYENVGEIKLILFDSERMWIFASAVGKQDTADLYVPADLFRFSGDVSSDLLKQPMMLFYDDVKTRDAADYRSARRVVSTESAIKGEPRRRITLGHIILPKTPFEMDTLTFERFLPRDQLPSVLCLYSETEFHLSLFGSQQKLPQLYSCRPFSEEALKNAVRR
ncbi:hypothetical protein ACS7SF_07145 [Ralstonia sp. 25C]|uniref:hypothetical protein n=1 Tax=Ralstonia sp. 25C TaxID=3447363 RepID=UPI003F74CA51